MLVKVEHMMCLFHFFTETLTLCISFSTMRRMLFLSGGKVGLLICNTYHDLNEQRGDRGIGRQ